MVSEEREEIQEFLIPEEDERPASPARQNHSAVGASYNKIWGNSNDEIGGGLNSHRAKTDRLERDFMGSI